MPRRPALLLPALAVNVIIASGTFLVAKRTLAEFPPLTLALLRFLLAAGSLWPLTRWLLPGRRIERADRPRILLLGLLAVPLNQGLFLVGMQWASASHAALLYALTPAFAILFLALGGGPPPYARHAIVTALPFAGVLALILLRGLHFAPHSLGAAAVIRVRV